MCGCVVLVVALAVASVKFVREVGSRFFKCFCSCNSTEERYSSKTVFR